jgi:hypothetical protein
MVLSLLATLLAGAMVASGAEDSLQPFEQDLERGRAYLSEFEFGSALGSFGRIVTAQREGRLDLSTPGARRLVTAALEGMAEAHLGAGNPEAAAEQFLKALEVNPAFEPDRQRHSPKLVSLFDEMRAEKIGYLDVSVRPFGARVWVNGTPMGESPLLGLARMAGRLEVRVEHPGFAPLTRSVSLAGGETFNLEDSLTPSARSVVFITSPPDVSIQVDGREMAVTKGPGSTFTADQLGLKPELLSREVLVKNLAPGTHRVRFERPCYRSHEMRIDVELDPDALPMNVPLVKLQRSVARLEIDSAPLPALVKIDSHEMGTTPLSIRDMCAGPHKLELVGIPRGRWSADLDLEPGETRQEMAILRPTVAYLGVAAGQDVSEEARARAATAVEEATAKLSRYHRLALDNAGGLDRARYLLPEREGALPKPGLDEVLEVASPLGADLLLVGQVRVKKLRPVLDLFLYSTFQEQPDVLSAPMDRPEALQRILAGLSERSRLARPTIGMRCADTRAEAHPVVTELFPSGSAESAGVQVGDRIVSVNGTPVSSGADWDAALHRIGVESEKAPSGRAGGISLVVDRAGGQGQEELLLSLSWGPDLVGPGRTDVLYNKRLVDLEYLAASVDDELRRSVMRLNQALAFIHFGRHDLAVKEALSRTALPEGQGISLGTVEYLRGWCYEQLGPDYRPEAVAAFEAAAEAKGATLETHQGPQVAPLAVQHLEALR